jgi:DNA-binding NarL/FixJ family response regulator
MTHSGSLIKVLVADDHTLVRRGMVSLLSLAEGIEVVGEAADGREAVEKALLLAPHVVLMDMSMPGLNGLEATQQIRKKAPGVKVLIVSAFDTDEYVLEVIRSGANGYLLKTTSADDLLAAIRAVKDGQAFFSPSVSKILLQSISPPSSSSPGARGQNEKSAPGRLTPREREVLQLIAEGHTHHQIAVSLSISTRTVDTHCNNIMRKLNIHETSGLTTYAIKNGIIILPK